MAQTCYLNTQTELRGLPNKMKDSVIWCFGTHLSGTTVADGDVGFLDPFATHLPEGKSGRNGKE